MGDVVPQFEQEDNSGSTKSFNGTAATSPIAIPTTPGQGISEALVVSFDKNLEVSFDGGVSYFFVDDGSVSVDVKGLPTQIFVRTTQSTARYSAILNFEDV